MQVMSINPEIMKKKKRIESGSLNGVKREGT